MSITNKNYRIVREPGEADHNFKTPPEIEGELDDLYSKVNKGKPSVKGRLDKLIKRYPGAPFLRNYLAMWYNVNQQPEAAGRVNDEIIRLFPNYIFAVSFKISALLAKDDLEAAERLLAGRLDIESFYPNRRAFHISELRACTSLAVDYLLTTGRFDEAEERINFLKEVDHNSFAAEMLQQKLIQRRMMSGIDPHKVHEELEIHSAGVDHVDNNSDVGPAGEEYYDEDAEVEEVTTPVVNIFAGASKNAPCPCGSGKKYKRCHGKD